MPRAHTLFCGKGRLMIVFYGDLDNTLIYSYKRETEAPRRWIEQYEGRWISFATEKTLANLIKIQDKAAFVPTTTRSVEQYGRIRLPGRPRFALVCNGGILLYDGKLEKDWYAASLRMTEESRPALEAAANRLAQDRRVILDVRLVGGLFVFTKSSAPRKTAQMLREQVDPRLADVYTLGREGLCHAKISG